MLSNFPDEFPFFFPALQAAILERGDESRAWTLLIFTMEEVERERESALL